MGCEGPTEPLTQTELHFHVKMRVGGGVGIFFLFLFFALLSPLWRYRVGTRCSALLELQEWVLGGKLCLRPLLGIICWADAFSVQSPNHFAPAFAVCS